MSKFQPGDRVRLTDDHSATATILAVHEDLYWVKYDDRWQPITAGVTHFDRNFELTPEPFLADGDQFYIVYANGVVSVAFASLASAEIVYRDSAGALGIIRIDGQTGEPSWAKGGPNGVAS